VVILLVLWLLGLVTTFSRELLILSGSSRLLFDLTDSLIPPDRMYITC
jgi:hypothetical protein